MTTSFFQVLNEKRFLQLCREGKADIREFSHLLSQGIDINIYDEVCTMERYMWCYNNIMSTLCI